jgi:hypothetical protein
MPLSNAAPPSAAPSSVAGCNPKSRLPAALLLPLLSLVCAAACESSLACPPGFSALGSFSVGFSPIDAGAACMINKMTDGGPADASLVSTPSSALMILCGGTTDAGDLSVSYSFRGSGTHSAKLDGGAFGQSNAGSTGQAGTACLCPLDLTETLTGTLRTADGGAFGLQDDGGFVQVTGITGTLTEAISASAGSTACACTLPCSAGFSYSSQ